MPTLTRVRITSKKHPHYGKEGWLTGKHATPPGSSTPMHEIVWTPHGKEGCYAEAGAYAPVYPKKGVGKKKAVEVVLDLLQATAPPPAERGNPIERSSKRKPKSGPLPGLNVRSKTRVKTLPDGTDPTEGGTLCGSGLRGKAGHYCRKTAGHGTDHPGMGRCSIHGGSTPIRSGRYSGITTRPRISELLAQFEQDPDPLNLLPEIALIRAIVLEFVERYDESREALLRWSMSFDKGFVSDWATWVREMREHVLDHEGDPDDPDAPKMPDPFDYVPNRPVTVVDMATAASIASQVGAMADRINKMREDKTYTLSTIRALQEAMGEDLEGVVRRRIKNDSEREPFLDEVEELWRAIRISGLAGARPRAGPAET